MKKLLACLGYLLYVAACFALAMWMFPGDKSLGASLWTMVYMGGTTAVLCGVLVYGERGKRRLGRCRAGKTTTNQAAGKLTTRRCWR